MTQFHNCTHLFIIWDAAVYRFRIPRCSMVVACINKVLVQRCTHFWSQVTANFLFSLKKCLFFLLFVYFGILQQMCKKICHDLRINDSFFSFTSQVCRLFTSTVTEPLQLTCLFVGLCLYSFIHSFYLHSHVYEDPLKQYITGYGLLAM